jgi:squalene-associated FAD-dependent desaturase
LGPTVAAWLHEPGKSPGAIDGFWKVVLVSALGESLNRASLAAARKVIVDGFLASPEACRVIVPRVSLGELYDERVAGWLRSAGVKIRLETPVAQIAAQGMRATGVRLTDGAEERFEQVVLAVPWHRLGSLLSPELAGIVDPEGRIASIPSSPIASVHLWFDRPITELPHAVFVGRLSQWMFARELGAGRGESYYQVVISAAHFLAEIERRSIIDEVERDLKAVFPAATGAKLLRSKLIIDPHAVFSIRPGTDLIRPVSRTPITNLYLAGDWTRTGWPATMEGAVRSGYQAAEAILEYVGQRADIVVPDLPQSWLMKELSGRS